MRRILARAGLCVALFALPAFLVVPAFSQDAREIVRKSVELDQLNWQRRADYTWVMTTRERHFDSQNRVTSDHQEALETLVLNGRPYNRLIEKDHQPLPPEDQKKEQERLDRLAARLDKETPAEKQRHIDEYEASRRRERRFLLEVPDAFDLRLEGDQIVDGQPVWVISGTPKPGYHARSREGAAMLKMRGKIWIEKAGYQWVRLEAQTTGTISFGWVLARLNPGAKLVLQQTRINDEVWLPSRLFLSGAGRVGLLKRIAEDEEVTWSNYRKFRVESKVVSASP
jgi:hypothetical protein